MKIFIDLETTGLSTAYCQIIEVAAIAVDDNDNEIEYFHELARPFKSLPAVVTELTGITDEMLGWARSEKEVLKSFISWVMGVGADAIVAYNASFDMRFLKDRSKYYGFDDYFSSFAVEDPLKTARALIKSGKIKTFADINIPGSKDGGAKLGQLAFAFGIEFNAHSAVEDIRATKACYYKMKNM